jgi:hypothetical protein
MRHWRLAIGTTVVSLGALGACGSGATAHVQGSAQEQSTATTFLPITVADGERTYDERARSTCQAQIDRETKDLRSLDGASETEVIRDLVAAYDTTADRAVTSMLRALEREKGHPPEQVTVERLEEIRAATTKATGSAPAALCWVLGNHDVLDPKSEAAVSWNVLLISSDSEVNVLIGSVNPALRPSRP